MINEPTAQAPGTRHQAPEPKALILTGFGINCEEEMAAAYQLAGAAPTIVHLNEVLHGRVSIHDFDVLNFPGGFSFGDDLGSGVVLANKLRYRQTSTDGRTLLSDIREFVAAGKFVLGICNGFQVLVKLGLLPNLGGNFEPEVTLTHNASGRYEDRWVRLTVNPRSKTPFLSGLTSLEVPVRHGEGRLVVPGAATRERIMALGLNCLTYAGHDDLETGTYPLNPNGADLNCAGLTDTTGQIFGLMPHPEAYLAGCNHPDWGRRKRRGELLDEGEGLAIFRNIVRHLHNGVPHSPAPGPMGRGSLTTLEEGYAGQAEAENLVAREDAMAYGEALGLRPARARRATLDEAAGTVQDDVFTTSAKRWQHAKEFGRAMRKPPTEAEQALWTELRGQKLGAKFRRQHAIDSFIVDFISLPDKLIIEVDGAIHNEPEQVTYNAGRTSILNELHYRVLRFTNDQILHELPQVLLTIKDNLLTPTVPLK